MGFSSRLRAHKKILTLETLRFIAEYLVDKNARMACLRYGIPETYASRHGQWLKKQPVVLAALENDLDESDIKQLHKLLGEIDTRIETCKKILEIE